MLDSITPSVAGKPTGALRRLARMADVDEWVTGLAGACLDLGACVVAVGGYGRGDLAPGSDIDILLLVPDGVDSQLIGAAADQLWYPIWDAGVRLDHSVRTVAQARAVARDDVRAALGLLDARTVCGDNALRARLADVVWSDWRMSAADRVAQLRDLVAARRERFGELAHLIEPDLKEAIGGLRDVGIVRALAATSLTDAQRPGLVEAADVLLDVRDALHSVTRRHADVLVRQDQEQVANAIGLSTADDLLRYVYEAGRVIEHSADITWRRVERKFAPTKRLGRVRRAPSTRYPLADGIVSDDGEVVLARNADPATDPILLLRAAAAAAQAGLTINPFTAARLARHAAHIPSPWPLEARDALVSLLGAGSAALPVWESLDQHHVWTALLPHWDAVRSAPQHNPVHRFAVDRHLVETAIEASAFVRTVDRPDLLLVAALLHDIGKGRGGDHSEVGAPLAADIAGHLGFDPADVATIERLVRHHLLLPDTATRRDPDDPATVSAVVSAVVDRATLELLHALAVADARATGPAACSDWRLSLIDALVMRVGSALGDVDGVAEPDRTWAQVGQGEGIEVELDQATSPAVLRVRAPDYPGLLAATAGVLAVHRVAVRTARTQTVGDRAVSEWGVTPLFGQLPDPSVVAQELRSVVSGQLDLAAVLAKRKSGPTVSAAPPVVSVAEGASDRFTVIEVRAHDGAGLLYRLATALTQAGCDIVAARVATLGSEALDVFYVVDRATSLPLDPAAAAQVVASVGLALTAD